MTSEALQEEMPAKVSRRVFASMNDYSITVPTGAYPFKRWKRREPFEVTSACSRTGVCSCHKWYMGEYVPTPDGKSVVIVWTLLQVT